MTDTAKAEYMGFEEEVVNKPEDDDEMPRIPDEDLDADEWPIELNPSKAFCNMDEGCESCQG